MYSLLLVLKLGKNEFLVEHIVLWNIINWRILTWQSEAKDLYLKVAAAEPTALGLPRSTTFDDRWIPHL